MPTEAGRERGQVGLARIGSWRGRGRLGTSHTHTLLMLEVVRTVDFAVGCQFLLSLALGERA